MKLSFFILGLALVLGACGGANSGHQAEKAAPSVKLEARAFEDDMMPRIELSLVFEGKKVIVDTLEGQEFTLYEAEQMANPANKLPKGSLVAGETYYSSMFTAAAVTAKDGKFVLQTRNWGGEGGEDGEPVEFQGEWTKRREVAY